MKKILIILFLFFGTNIAQSGDQFGKFQISYFDTVLGSDSGQIRVDTSYSKWEVLLGRFLNFASEVIGGARDTNFVDDSMFIDLQLSYDGRTLVTIEIDTALDNVSLVLDETIYDADATALPPLGRLRFIHYDSFPVGTGIPDTLPSEINNIYEKTINLWWGGR